jgi:hypothetical protein
LKQEEADIALDILEESIAEVERQHLPSLVAAKA